MAGKVCKGCREWKPYTSFYRHRKMRDGYVNFCNVCEVERKKRKPQTPAVVDTSGLRLEHVPTMPRRTRIAWAADRYGKVEPSPDDILMARWPKYEVHDRKHIAGYHADSVEVDRIVMARIEVDAPRCMVCEKPMPGHHNKRYCGPECLAMVTREQKARNQEAAATRISPEERERIVLLRTTTDMTLIELAAHVRRSVDAVRRVLSQAGVRGGSPRPKGSDSMSLSLGAA